MENLIRFKIGEVEFEAKGDDGVIAREREAFLEKVLPIISETKLVINQHQKQNQHGEKEVAKPQQEVILQANPPTQQVKKSKRKKDFSPQLVKDLDLRGSDTVKSFRSFVEEKKPKNNIHFTAVAVFYLDKLTHHEKIDANVIYTCYKELGRKIPTNIPQNLYDTSSRRYGFIDQKGESYSISLRGENLVEHDLPGSK